MTAPAPSPQEQAAIDRFGIFDEERIVEEVARALEEAENTRDTDVDWYCRLAAAAITAYRAQDGGEGYHVELGGQRFTQAQWEAMLVWRTGTDMPTDAQDGGADEALRDALLRHHPIANTMDGPLKGCRCGQVQLGQDVIAHVAAELRAAQDGGLVGSGGPGLVALHPGETYSTFEQVRAALAPQAGDGAR